MAKKKAQKKKPTSRTNSVARVIATRAKKGPTLMVNPTPKFGCPGLLKVGR